jgi:hypothetical protein
MQTSLNAHIALPGIMIARVLGSPLTGHEDDGRQRERIGGVFGKPVYRDEIRSGKSVSLPGELHRLFTSAANRSTWIIH